jgi:TorA maturation chaperone TorD
MTTAAVSPGVERAAFWRLLSLGFAPPREETLAEVEALSEALRDCGDRPEVDDLLAAIGSTTLEALATEHQRLFGGTVLVAPYEGSYELDPVRQGREMADVAAFYRAFGAEAHGPVAERPDHVGCELEFLAFLELRSLAAVDEGDDDGAELVERIAASFLCDHPGRWLPAFFGAVREAARTAGPFYRALAALGSRVVADELDRRDLEPTPLPQRHERLAVERDSFDCG